MKRTLMHTIRAKKMLTLAHDESGAAAIICALALILLCGVVALALDFGHVVMVKAELQRTADAAALAGATGLLPYINPGPGTQTPNWVQGQQKAHTLINNAANEVDTYNFSITDGTVAYGYWFLQPSTGYVQLPLSTVPTPAANLPEPALNVTLSRNITLYFAPIIGVSSPLTVSAAATAILPAAYQTTGFPPIAMDYNTVYTTLKGTVTIDVLTQDIKIQSNGGIAGWFNLDGGNSVPSVRIAVQMIADSTGLAANSQIFLVPGSKATLTNYMTNGETIVVPVVQDVSQKIWQAIVGFAAFQIDPDGLGSNSITGHFVDQYFDPNVTPVAATDGTISDVSGTPYLVSP
jgi:putative Flp pilus-assembly TadE/G-like protein/putative Tad-like protein involved in Flp pilus assembly